MYKIRWSDTIINKEKLLKTCNNRLIKKKSSSVAVATPNAINYYINS